MILNEIVAAIADAIREKTGKSELIAPVNFAEEIKSISAGGGESGGSNVEYIDVSGGLDVSMDAIGVATLYVKTVADNVVRIIPISNMGGPGMGTIVALCVDFSAEVTASEFGAGDGLISIRQILIDIAGISREQLDAIPRITKEQFYDLNA